MVELSVSVFKDAAEGLDKLIDAVRKLAELISDSASKGTEFFDAASARSLKKKLSHLHSTTTNLWIGQVVRLRTTLSDFVADPRPED